MTLLTEISKAGIATVTLNRPEKHNAMNAELIAALTQTAQDLATKPLRAIILRGVGKSFCAGGDLSWMQAQAQADRAGKQAEAGTLADMLAAWNDLPHAVIARIHGATYGGGIGLAAIADSVIAAPDTKFALTETRLGLIPATIGPFVAAKIGQSHARRLFTTAAPFTPAEAQQIGLVHQIAEDLDAAVAQECAHLMKTAPGAVAAAKALAKSFSDDPKAHRDATLNALADCWEGDEGQEGIAAFFARKPPPWAT